MKFLKFAVLGVVLASSAPLALADRIYGEIFTAGTGRLTSTSMTFSNPKAANPNKNTSAGVVLFGSTQDLSVFTFGNPVLYIAGAPGSPAKLTFASVSLVTPVLLYEIIESGQTLDFFINEIDSVTAGGPSVTGTFSGAGYVTLTGHTGTTNVTFTLTNSSPGAGEKGFSTDLIAPTPEPSTLALLGTGAVGAAVMMFRRRRTT